jgi:hypothetical protein
MHAPMLGSGAPDDMMAFRIHSIAKHRRPSSQIFPRRDKRLLKKGDRGEKRESGKSTVNLGFFDCVLPFAQSCATCPRVGLLSGLRCLSFYAGHYGGRTRVRNRACCLLWYQPWRSKIYAGGEGMFQCVRALSNASLLY